MGGARRRLIRVLCLALMLVLANSFSAWAMPPVSGAGENGAANASAHHCGEPADSHTTPAHPHEHGGASCPCCSAGCFCLQAGAAPLPQFVIIRGAPDASIPVHTGNAPPTPPVAEHLRPPIA
jgi:hypothetical protein